MIHKLRFYYLPLCVTADQSDFDLIAKKDRFKPRQTIRKRIC